MVVHESDEIPNVGVPGDVEVLSLHRETVSGVVVGVVDQCHSLNGDVRT